MTTKQMTVAELEGVHVEMAAAIQFEQWERANELARRIDNLTRRLAFIEMGERLADAYPAERMAA